MSTLEKLKESGMIEPMRECLGLDADDASRDEEIANFDDVTIARYYVIWRNSKETIDIIAS